MKMETLKVMNTLSSKKIQGKLITFRKVLAGEGVYNPITHVMVEALYHRKRVALQRTKRNAEFYAKLALIPITSFCRLVLKENDNACLSAQNISRGEPLYYIRNKKRHANIGTYDRWLAEQYYQEFTTGKKQLR